MPYTIQRGDTLWAIAQRNHTTVGELLSLNPELKSDPRYQNGNMIWSGGSIRLPGDPNTSSSSSSSASKSSSPAAPAPPSSRPNIADTLLQELQGLPGSERDAYAALKTLFDSYGLDALAPTILTYLQDGFGSDTITVLLQQTPEYRARFSGNDARTANGLAVLTPAEYLSTEASYRQLLQSAGLDPAFMTQQQYAEWIGKDISPTEIQNRVNLASQATTQAPPTLLTAFNQLGINNGDLVSYFLNDNNAMPQLQLKMNQAQIMAAGLQNGVTVNSNVANTFAQQGVTYTQAQSAYQKVADVLPTAQQLSQIYKNQSAVDQGSLEQLYMGGSGSPGSPQLAVSNLSQQETAAFTGQGGVGDKSFKQQTQGTGF